MTVSVDVKNTGARDGDEVVQLYVAHVGSTVARPLQELKGFRRVTIRAGETRTVTIPLKASSLAYWDGKGFRWRATMWRFAWAALPTQLLCASRSRSASEEASTT